MENTTTSFLLPHKLPGLGLYLCQKRARQHWAALLQRGADFLVHDVVAVLGRPTWQSHCTPTAHPGLMHAVSLAWGTAQLHAYMQ